jgi:hypothetical protein
VAVVAGEADDGGAIGTEVGEALACVVVTVAAGVGAAGGGATGGSKTAGGVATALGSASTCGGGAVAPAVDRSGWLEGSVRMRGSTF